MLWHIRDPEVAVLTAGSTAANTFPYVKWFETTDCSGPAVIAHLTSSSMQPRPRVSLLMGDGSFRVRKDTAPLQTISALSREQQTGGGCVVVTSSVEGVLETNTDAVTMPATSFTPPLRPQIIL